MAIPKIISVKESRSKIGKICRRLKWMVPNAVPMYLPTARFFWLLQSICRIRMFPIFDPAGLRYIILEPIALHLLARQRRADLNREIKSCSGKTCRSIYLPCASKWNLRPLFDTAPAKQLIVGDHDFEMDFSSLWPALACLSLPLAHKTGSKPLWSRISIFKSPMQFHKTWIP